MKDEQTKLILYFIFSVLFIVVTTNYLDDLDIARKISWREHFPEMELEKYDKRQ